MIAVIFTQVYENYGTASEPFWKAKGGQEIKLTGVSEKTDLNLIRELADLAFSEDSDMYEEYIVDIALKPDDYLSEFERSQLEYDGAIVYPEKSVKFSDIYSKYQSWVETKNSYEQDTF